MDSLHTQPTSSAQSAQLELAAATQIEQLQIAHWCALLSYPPSLPTISAQLELHLPPCGELDAWMRAASQASNEQLDTTALYQWGGALYARDSTREVLPQVDACVQSAFERDAGAGAYLAALALARATHRRAKHQLVLANMALVRSLAKRYAGSTASIAELIQEGSIGLLRAVELFDYRRGLRFSTYAVWWIRNAFHRCISEQTSAVRAPTEALRAASVANRFIWSSYGRTGQKLNLDEVAEHLGESVASLQSSCNTRTVSLDRSLEQDGLVTFLDQLVDKMPSVEVQVGNAMLRRSLELSLGKLPALESTILRRRFGLIDGVETPLSVIAREHHLTYDRALQLSRQALRRLRYELERGGLQETS
ncbi:MAG: polymerase sigma factor rpoD [Myxococcaceae bacterium]|nr:polymerase sigma factor rpoD [Myxococcaceae bacterium]